MTLLILVANEVCLSQPSDKYNFLTSLTFLPAIGLFWILMVIVLINITADLFSNNEHNPTNITGLPLNSTESAYDLSSLLTIANVITSILLDYYVLIALGSIIVINSFFRGFNVGFMFAFMALSLPAYATFSSINKVLTQPKERDSIIAQAIINYDMLDHHLCNSPLTNGRKVLYFDTNYHHAIVYLTKDELKFLNINSTTYEPEAITLNIINNGDGFYIVPCRLNDNINKNSDIKLQNR